MAVEIRVLKKEDDRSSFSCGDIALDYFFQKYAGQNQFKHYIGTTYVAVEKGELLGFVSVSSGSLARDGLPQGIRKKLPCYPLPVLKITRIGVDRRFQNHGIGRRLLEAMFRLSLKQKEMSGCVGVVVDAKVEAVAFYEKLGFIVLDVKHGLSKNYPEQVAMFLVIGSIEKALHKRHDNLAGMNYQDMTGKDE
ncbi:MAG: hypothetical protein B5M52_05780 [Helicobacteraceae bacterium 4484_230]|nr:MAG: hypothetical protein B5M52_05780 [Helicobacteraceae bacterium 4484_230]